MLTQRNVHGISSMLVNCFSVPSRYWGNRQRGLSIVELLVGVALGLLITSGAISLFVTNLGNTRRLIVEARMNQDLRTAADLIARDLRRAGYWTNSIDGTIASGVSSTTSSNPYIAVNAGSSEISYNFARDTNNILNTNEQFGFRLNSGVIEMKTDAATWQAITNPNVVTISTFTIIPTVTVLPTGDVCQKTCAAGAVSPEGTNCPTLTVRQYNMLLRGNAPGNNTVTRELQSSIRVRNDQFAGVCPL